MRPMFTLTPRPANIPDGWRIYNAPRPLPGVYSWQDSDLPSAFCTSQPADADEADLEALHAAQVFYLSMEQVKTFVSALLRQEDPDEAEESIRCCEQYGFWKDEFYRLVAGKTADEVEELLLDGLDDEEPLFSHAGEGEWFNWMHQDAGG